MKKVLHRSFKPAKCKIALQMATSRLKILKNKKDTQIKQLRRELANLLDSGQTQTAKIRVEHVVREEKTMAAYELVGIYCELLVARLGVIESQKTCSNDLKEAVSSVLYASQRLSDVAELADIVKQFSAKYGKDFVSAAIGLQSDSGVSRLLVEKLSVKAPDGPTKIKVLKEIATEHNVTWEDESLVESDPKETVLSSGASSSQPLSGINLDSSRIPSNQPPNFHAPVTVGVSQNSYAIDERVSNRTHDSTSSDFNTSKTADHHTVGKTDPRPSGEKTNDDREHRHPNRDNVNSSPWETEFVDATTAARAAAESAERASFAARAAAELSKKERMIMMQNATDSQNSSSYETSRNEPLHRRSSSSSSNKQSEDRARSSNRQDDHSWENSLETRPSNSSAKQQPSIDDLNLSSSGDVLFEKLPSRGSSHSQSSNLSYYNDVTGPDHIASPSVFEENRFQSPVKDSESDNHGPDIVVGTPDFDDYSSYFDKPQFDTEDVHYDEPEQGLGFSLLGGSSSKTPDHIPTEKNSWSFEERKSLGEPSSASTTQVFEKEKQSSPLFDDGPTSPASLHEPEPLSAKFDDYDRDSESEEDSLRNKGILSEEKPKLTSHKSSVSEVPDDLGRYFFPSDSEDQGDDFKSDAETSTGLGFGSQAGGLSNETLPPYDMSPPRDKTLSKSVQEDVQTEIESSSQTVSSSSTGKDLYTPNESNRDKKPVSVLPDSSSSDDETEMELRNRLSIRNQTESRTRPTHLHSHIIQEDSEEEIPIRASIKNQEKRTRKPTPASASYFYSMSSDEEDGKELRKDASYTHTKPAISSRRTKGQERRSSMVTEKTNIVSQDQESPPKLILDDGDEDGKELRRDASYIQNKPAIFSSRRTKGQERRSSLVTVNTNIVSQDQESPPKLILDDGDEDEKELHRDASYIQNKPAIFSSRRTKGQESRSSLVTVKTNIVSQDQESPPKLIPEVKPPVKQQASASSISLSKTGKASLDQESPPKLIPEVKPLAKQQGSDSSISLSKTGKASHVQESPPKAKQQGSASSSSYISKTVRSPDPETPAKEKAKHVHPKLPDYDDIFAKLEALRR